MEKRGVGVGVSFSGEWTAGRWYLRSAGFRSLRVRRDLRGSGPGLGSGLHHLFGDVALRGPYHRLSDGGFWPRHQ